MTSRLFSKFRRKGLRVFFVTLILAGESTVKANGRGECKVPAGIGKIGERKLSPSNTYLALSNASQRGLKVGSSRGYLIVVVHCESGRLLGFEGGKPSETHVYAKNLRWAQDESSLVYDLRAGKSHVDLKINIAKEFAEAKQNLKR